MCRCTVHVKKTMGEQLAFFKTSFSSFCEIFQIFGFQLLKEAPIKCVERNILFVQVFHYLVFKICVQVTEILSG